MSSQKLWSGRFQKETDALVEDFHSSISFDRRLYPYDIQGSIAHARMLGRVGIITPDEATMLVVGLAEVLADLKVGRVEFSQQEEDVHMNIESLLTAKIGEVGKKLHTGRSRNDQVALDLRLYLKAEITQIQELLRQLQMVLLDLAEAHLDTLMPGYTHLQRAQPVTFAHHLLAYCQMLQRDAARLADCYQRTDQMPLGSGALAGSTFPLDRHYVAEQLGFAGITANSLDGVSDRDFAVEFTAAAALIMVHLSRFCEEIVLWSTAEFAFVELDDAYSTGSSMMPQKKNPDVAELIRGKTGRVCGDLQALLTMLKGLPLAYNKDLQEDKEALFDAVDTLKKSLLVFAPLVKTMRVNKEVMSAASRQGFTVATDLADYLARKGLPFRDAHGVVGRLVFYCLEQQTTLEALSLTVLQEFCPLVEEDVYQALGVEQCIAARNLPGGPAKEVAEKTIRQLRQTLQK